jgi:hypothetical protein
VALRDYTSLKGVTHVGDSKMLTILENNLKSFLDWGLLGIGAWFDVDIPTSGVYGGTFHKLRLVDDPSYTAGQVWEAPRKDLVWESGVSYPGGTGVNDPIQISGVYIGGTQSEHFKAFENTEYPHHVNYPLGRVVFDSDVVGSGSVTTTTDVYMDYSYRWVQTYIAGNAPWWQELQYGSFRVDSEHATQTGSGDWSIGAQHRVQLPAIVIEAVPRRTSKGYELGSAKLRVSQDVLFHVLAETKWERDQIVDILTLQNQKTIYLFNVNTLSESNDYPLDDRGMKVNNSNYPDFVSESGYRYSRVYFKDSVLSQVQSPNPALKEATVRTTFEIVGI